MYMYMYVLMIRLAITGPVPLNPPCLWMTFIGMTAIFNLNCYNRPYQINLYYLTALLFHIKVSGMVTIPIHVIEDSKLLHVCIQNTNNEYEHTLYMYTYMYNMCVCVCVGCMTMHLFFLCTENVRSTMKMFDQPCKCTLYSIERSAISMVKVLNLTIMVARLCVHDWVSHHQLMINTFNSQIYVDIVKGQSQWLLLYNNNLSGYYCSSEQSQTSIKINYGNLSLYEGFVC